MFKLCEIVKPRTAASLCCRMCTFSLRRGVLPLAHLRSNTTVVFETGQILLQPHSEKAKSPLNTPPLAAATLVTKQGEVSS